MGIWGVVLHAGRPSARFLLSGLVLFWLCFWLCGSLVFAEEEKLPKESGTGKAAADKYFEKESKLKVSDHYMAIHLGGFTDGTAFVWGPEKKVQGVGREFFGVTYRFDVWRDTVDLLFRANFTHYEIADTRPLKMSALALWAFPEAASQFPLYFGFGLGPGIFFKQVDNESSLSLDYQLIMGVRFFNMLGAVGFFCEAGLQNHILLMSDGQFNGVFLSAGTVLSF